jgi:hypothetical protein
MVVAPSCAPLIGRCQKRAASNGFVPPTRPALLPGWPAGGARLLALTSKTSEHWSDGRRMSELIRAPLGGQ